MQATKSHFSLFIVLLMLLIPRMTSAGLISDSGQTLSYTGVKGEDSDYIIHPASFTKLNDAGDDLAATEASWTMVRDDVTGLIWEVKTDEGSIHDTNKVYTLSEANTFVSELNAESYGGRDDWRLPTIKELASIIDRTHFDPYANTTYFPNTQLNYYWTATSFADDAEKNWVMNFKTGYATTRNGEYHVRVVSGGGSDPENQFVNNMDGTVTDESTGLMWQQGSSSDMLPWKDAILYCEKLVLAGYDDWRLPSIEELRSIVDYSTTNPAVSFINFPNTKPFYYWSSTTNAKYTNSAWNINFEYGYGSKPMKTDMQYARAVRGGELSTNSMQVAPPDGPLIVNPSKPEEFFAAKVMNSGNYLKIKFPAYTQPVDLYLALVTPDYQLLLLDSDETWTANLIPFAIGQTESVVKQFDLELINIADNPGFPYRDWSVYWIVVNTSNGVFDQIDVTNYEFGFYDIPYK